MSGTVSQSEGNKAMPPASVSKDGCSLAVEASMIGLNADFKKSFEYNVNILCVTILCVRLGFQCT